jgi:hypothetical protein
MGDGQVRTERHRGRRLAAHEDGGPVSRSSPFEFVSWEELAGRPHVVVDGTPTTGTVLCLSHWPGTSCPAAFRADLSAQMAFAYLDAFDRHGAATAVTANHVDQDGLVSLFALSRPADALVRKDLLLDVATAADFGTFDSRRAARISMAVAALADPARTPLVGLPTDRPSRTGALLGELLGRLPELCDHPDRWRDLWAEEDASLSASQAALDSGRVTIEEVADVDLAVVTVDQDAPSLGGHRFGEGWAAGLHPMAVYNATDRLCVLAVRGRHYEFHYRYESWVQLCSRTPLPRKALQPLAERLNDEEAGPGRWVGDPVDELTPALRLDGADESTLPAARIQELVVDHLRRESSSWSPTRGDDQVA